MHSGTLLLGQRAEAQPCRMVGGVRPCWRGVPCGRLLADLGLPGSPFEGDVISAVRFHRILRRGREYGPSFGLRQRVLGLPPFVTMRGGAYFVLPGVRALRFLAGVSE